MSDMPFDRLQVRLAWPASRASAYCPGRPSRTGRAQQMGASLQTRHPRGRGVCVCARARARARVHAHTRACTNSQTRCTYAVLPTSCSIIVDQSGKRTDTNDQQFGGLLIDQARQILAGGRTVRTALRRFNTWHNSQCRSGEHNQSD